MPVDLTVTGAKAVFYSRLRLADARVLAQRRVR